MKRALAFLLLAAVNTAAHAADPVLPLTHPQDEDQCELETGILPFACVKANAAQLKQVNLGNSKKTKFLNECVRATGSTKWCAQVLRPNPDSKSIFACTYGAAQVHQLIHPNEATWKNAFEAIRLIQDLESSGLRVAFIYNWWRPEPYNKNVGGSAGRHPFGTSVDVRFQTNADADRGFNLLCRYRKQGRLRAIGHYGTNALHFGVGDGTANTWGRACP